MRPYQLSVLIVAFVTLLLLSWTALAQDDSVDSACPALVSRALVEVGTNCDSLGRNSACYGFDQVDTAFAEAVTEEHFTVPADVTELATIQSIQTAPLNLENETWGVAVMNVQANVPNILPGQAVTFILLGDAQVENAVAPENIIEYEAFTVVPISRANVRSGAGTNNNVLGVVDAGISLTADALNPERTWARIVYGGRLAWVSLEVLEPITDIDTLPTTESDLQSPMQAFYFSTGIGQPVCNEAPNIIGVRSPDNLVVDLSVNGANISVGSFITFQSTALDEFLMTVIEGHVEGEDGQEVNEGETIPGRMDENGNITEWGQARPATEEELYLGELFEEEEVFVELGVEEDTPEVNTSVGCAGFQPTSPLLGLGYGFNTFFWDGAGGNISNYRVVVVNQETGGSVSGQTANGVQTSLGVNLTQETIGGGFSFAWYVEALQNGRVVCTSQTVALARGAEVVAPPATGGATPFNAWIDCQAYDMTFFWDSLPAGETVTWTLNDYAVPYNSGAQAGPDGNYYYYTGSAIDATNITATSSGGYVVSVGNCP